MTPEGEEVQQGARSNHVEAGLSLSFHSLPFFRRLQPLSVSQEATWTTCLAICRPTWPNKEWRSLRRATVQLATTPSLDRYTIPAPYGILMKSFKNSCFLLNFCGKVNMCYDRGRSSQRWVGSGIRSTSCVSSANRSSARATSSSIAARRTASATTTCCTHRAASTATAPSLTWVWRHHFVITWWRIVCTFTLMIVVLQKCMTAMDRTFHPECFACTQCNISLGEDGFHEIDSQPYCR